MRPSHARALLSHFGDAAAVEAAAMGADAGPPPEDLTAAAYASLLASVRRCDPASELERLARVGGDIIPFDDPRFPRSLMQIPDPPSALRVAGDPAVLAGVCVAVVGTRRCSEAGTRQAGRFAGSLSGSGLTIVSGGARGIDAEAHRATLRAGGRTAVVMGCGIGRVYPPEHGTLFDSVRKAGGVLLSEYPMDRGPRPGQFPRRNRLISGLSAGVLVVEAPRRSGAMLTARLAVESHGRDCWAVPGDAGQRACRGGLEAIRDGWAACVLDPADVLADVVADVGGDVVVGDVCGADGAASQTPPELGAVLAPMEFAVVQALRRGGCAIGTLIEELGHPIGGLMRAVTALELSGILTRAGSQLSLTPAGLQVAAAHRRAVRDQPS
jgi:DNA processing protein